MATVTTDRDTSYACYNKHQKLLYSSFSLALATLLLHFYIAVNVTFGLLQVLENPSCEQCC